MPHVAAEHGLSQQAASHTSEMMGHELDDDTVRLLQPVNMGEMEMDEDFEKEFAALVPGVAPSARPLSIQVGPFIPLVPLVVECLLTFI